MALNTLRRCATDVRSISNGKAVGDVTAHPAFRNSIRSYASLYDYQARPENVEKMTFVSPDSGNRVSRIWELPTSYDATGRAARRARSVDGTALRLHGPLAGSRRIVHLGHVHGHRPVRAVRSGPRRRTARLLQVCTRQRSLPDLRDRQSASQSGEVGARAGGQVSGGRHRRSGRGRHHGARREDAGDERHHGERSLLQLHPAAAPRRRDVRAVVRNTDEREGHEGDVAQIVRGACALGVRQPAVEPLRRERRSAVLRRRQGAVGTDLRRRRRRDVREAVSCDSGARLPELSVPGAPDDEAALPRRPGAQDLGSQRHQRASRRCARRWASSRPRRRWSRRMCTAWKQRAAWSTATTCRTATCSTARRCSRSSCIRRSSIRCANSRAAE